MSPCPPAAGCARGLSEGCLLCLFHNDDKHETLMLPLSIADDDDDGDGKGNGNGDERDDDVGQVQPSCCALLLPALPHFH